MGRKGTTVLDAEEETETEDQEQLELENMPPASPVGKAARAYRKADEKLKAAVELLKEAKGGAKSKLVEELKTLKKDSVLVDGYTYRLEHTEEAYDVKIVKPKIRG